MKRYRQHDIDSALHSLPCRNTAIKNLKECCFSWSHSQQYLCATATSTKQKLLVEVPKRLVNLNANSTGFKKQVIFDACNSGCLVPHYREYSRYVDFVSCVYSLSATSRKMETRESGPIRPFNSWSGSVVIAKRQSHWAIPFFFYWINIGQWRMPRWAWGLMQRSRCWWRCEAKWTENHGRGIALRNTTRHAESNP